MQAVSDTHDVSSAGATSLVSVLRDDRPDNLAFLQRYRGLENDRLPSGQPTLDVDGVTEVSPDLHVVKADRVPVRNRRDARTLRVEEDRGCGNPPPRA